MARWQLPAEMGLWISSMAGTLHARLGWRLLVLFIGILFARGRRTVASWLRGADITSDYKNYYYFLGSLGHNIKLTGSVMLSRWLEVLPPGATITLALDDTPTKRYGKHVEGAGLHHNPTPGPADQQFLYGHVWVTLAVVVRHPLWGTIGLPLWGLPYVREKDIGPLRALYKVQFKTKLELAAELVEWAAAWLKNRGHALAVTADGAYAKQVFLKRAQKAGVRVYSRLRKDAALCSVPAPKRAGQRGPQATYGQARISLAKRAGQGGGWQTDTFVQYNKKVTKTYKTFLATYRPAGGLIRVVLVKEDDGWVAFFCSDPTATVAEILETMADRAAIEQVYHDIKEVHGAGQQQVRNYWANVAAFNMNLWMHTLIEMWAWHKSHAELVDRSASPWDDPTRRPSHADRRNALRRECLGNAFPHAELEEPMAERLRNLWNQLVKLAA